MSIFIGFIKVCIAIMLFLLAVALVAGLLALCILLITHTLTALSAAISKCSKKLGIKLPETKKQEEEPKE